MVVHDDVSIGGGGAGMLGHAAGIANLAVAVGERVRVRLADEVVGRGVDA